VYSTMSIGVLTLVLTAAAFHAGWNYLAKATGGGAALAALASALSTAVFLPVLPLALAAGERLDGTLVVVAALSGALHAGYFLSLQRSYSVGDLSLVYPLARGVGPLIAAGAAIAFLGERPSPMGGAGALLILAAVVSMAATESRGLGGRVSAATFHAFVTGVLIAGYTLWDKHAVSGLGLTPLLYYWVVNTTEAVCMTPLLQSRSPEVRRLWRERRAHALGIAVLSPVAYLLILFALKHAPVSYVAPARELSVVIGAAMGARMLSERHGPSRMAAAVMIVVGIAAMALG
jgi:drug/metabolite transporter (DMT)-like permease